MKKEIVVNVMSLAMQAAAVVLLWVVAGALMRGVTEMFMLGYTLFNFFPA